MVGCVQNAIFGAAPMAHLQDLAIQATAGQGVPFYLPECLLPFTFKHTNQGRFHDISQSVGLIDKMIT